MRIYLIGFMGSGKTTVGKKLAKKLGFSFIDLDLLIEEQQKMSINTIFEQKGELAFREIEKIVLQSTIHMQNIVVACGGGLPCFFDNMAWMNANGQTLYIKMAPKSLFNRLINAKMTRPLLKDKTDEELLVFIEEKLEERAPFYLQAKYTTKGEDFDLNQVIELMT